MTKIRFHPARRSATEILGGMIVAGCAALALLAPCPAGARYLPDTTIAPNGVIDISIRGDAVIVPAALFTTIDGNGFVTVARRDATLAICAYTTGAVPQGSFGSNGCYRETLPAGELPYQFLVGKTGYWLLIADAVNAQRFTLLRLTSSGQPDGGYGPLGRRSFELACEAGDTAPRCPELRGGGAQQPLYTQRFLAETGDAELWLLGSRKTAAGADEGVVLRLSQGRAIVARANLHDALPPAWLPSLQQGVTMPIGIAAHGDGILVELRTNFGYALLRVAANGAIDRGFAATQPNAVIVAGDGALPVDFFQRPVVAADNTFFWGLASGASGRTRYDRSGATLGTLPLPDSAYRTHVIAAPPSFAGAATALWLADSTRIGRWQNGQWDPAVFGGQGPYQPAIAKTQFALTGDLASLAMANMPTTFASSSAPVQLSVVATERNPQPAVAPPVLQVDAVLAASGYAVGIDPDTFDRSATQADGQIVWQRVTFDPLATAPAIATGLLAALPSGTAGSPLVSDASATGARWAVRTLTTDFLKPVEFYADAIGSTLPARRINMDAIRADMPAFIPVTPFSNPRFLNVDIAADGSALALISYAHGTSSAYQFRLALLRWNSNTVTGNDYAPQALWYFDLGPGSFFGVQRDMQGRLLLTDSGIGRVRRISGQGVLDPRFAQSGTLDLAALGLVAADFNGASLAAVSLADGGAWIGGASRVFHVSDSGQVVGEVKAAPQPPYVFQSTTLVYGGLLAGNDGSLLRQFAPSQQPATSSRTYRLLRYTPAGALDMQFGLRGAENLTVAGAQAGTATAAAPVLVPLAGGALAALQDNTITVYRLDPAQPGASGATVPVVEFYNTTLDHYFITADVSEIAGIETGAAGPGWQRTGLTFPAYAGLLDAPGEALDICRFYGSAVPLARSPNGRTGPNSHFYTFAGPECDSVYNKDKAWQYEGPRLALLPLLAGKSCAAGQQPVFRAYNNGYQASGGVWTRNDSNHRYSTSRAVISEMAGKGWIDEGPTFCAPEK